jgi:hypothetical protein
MHGQEKKAQIVFSDKVHYFSEGFFFGWNQLSWTIEPKIDSESFTNGGFTHSLCFDFYLSFHDLLVLGLAFLFFGVGEMAKLKKYNIERIQITLKAREIWERKTPCYKSEGREIGTSSR